jgi:hypothetical protein
LVKILKAADNDNERQQAELALLVVCSRGGQQCADGIIAEMADADIASQVALLRALARAGGDKSLEKIVASLDDDNEAVRAEAVRMLASWPDPVVVPELLSLAKESENLRDQVLAIRGLVRLARPQGDQGANLEVLSQAMDLAKRRDEKKLVLGALGDANTAEALALVMPALDNSAVAEEAALAAVLIAEKMESGQEDDVQAAMKEVQKKAKNPETRKRAKELQ